MKHRNKVRNHQEFLEDLRSFNMSEEGKGFLQDIFTSSKKDLSNKSKWWAMLVDYCATATAATNSEGLVFRRAQLGGVQSVL